MVRLAQMPSYVGINKEENSSITWTNDDTSACIFDMITTCRVTPAQKLLEQENMCLAQILSGNPLKNCRTKHAKVNLPYIQQVQTGRWMISTNNTFLHCIRTTTQIKPATKTAVWSENEEAIIPPVAIISVPNGTTIYCPGFNLPGPITPDSKSIINIIKNLSTVPSMNEITDMHQDLLSNETWEKLPYINGDIDALLEKMISQTTQKSNNDDRIPWHSEHAGKVLIIIMFGLGLFILVIIIVLFLRRTKQPTDNIVRIALQSVNG